jgi:hypothetical protein
MIPIITITRSTVVGLIERANEVINCTHLHMFSLDDVLFDLPTIYQQILTEFDLSNFVAVGLRDDIMQGIEQNSCDARYLRNLKGVRVLHPLLTNSEGIIVDGNHRAVKRWKLGQTVAPAYRVPDKIMQSAIIRRDIAA